jgi:hypothetical protein
MSEKMGRWNFGETHHKTCELLLACLKNSQNRLCLLLLKALGAVDGRAAVGRDKIGDDWGDHWGSANKLGEAVGTVPRCSQAHRL